MAGVSFELQEILSKKGLFSFVRAAGYAIALSSGNWLLATGAILVLGALAQKLAVPPLLFLQYKTYVTYVIALSLIVSGAFQLLFTRYVADRLFELALERVFPNYCGALLLVMGAGCSVGLGLSFVLCRGLPLTFHLLFVATLGVLSGIWLTSSLLVGLKNYGRVALAFLLGYALIVSGTPFGFRFGLFGGIFVFYLGQLILLCLLAACVWQEYPSNTLIEWDFLRKGRSYPALAFMGLSLNFALWIDKFLFWSNPGTGENVFGHFRASPLYDVPVFLAYLSLVPGFAVLFLKLEVDFSRAYDAYYRAARNWGTLGDLFRLQRNLLESAQATFADALRAQAVFIVLFMALEHSFLNSLGIKGISLPLLRTLFLGAFLQLALFALWGLLSYFDRRKELLWTAILFALLNGSCTWVTLRLGPALYGYGYVASLSVVIILAFQFLRRFLDEIHYWTFMRPGG